jgi:hypothetical protein
MENLNNTGIRRNEWAFPCAGIFRSYTLNQRVSRKLFSASDPTAGIVRLIQEWR